MTSKIIFLFVIVGVILLGCSPKLTEQPERVTSAPIVVKGAACEQDIDCHFIINSPYPEPSCLNPDGLGPGDWDIDSTMSCFCVEYTSPEGVVTSLDGAKLCQLNPDVFG